MLFQATQAGHDEIVPTYQCGTKGKSVHLYEDQVGEQYGGSQLATYRLAEGFERHRLNCDRCAAAMRALQAAWTTAAGQDD